MKLIERVKHALWENPELRDSDPLLVAHLWQEDMIAVGMEYKKYYLSHYLAMVENKILTKHDSITRLRRMVQNDYHYLRGHKYEQRHRLGEDIKNDTNILKSNE